MQMNCRTRPAGINLYIFIFCSEAWPPRAIYVPQDCFEHTDWGIFRKVAMFGGSANLEEYTMPVTGIAEIMIPLSQ